MKFKNSLVVIFFVIIWLVNNIGQISLQNRIVDFDNLVKINGMLDSFVGIFMVTYLFVFYSYSIRSGLEEHLLVRMNRRKYILHVTAKGIIGAFLYSEIYMLVSVIGNLVFAAQILIHSQRYLQFVFLQFIGLFMYLCFVSNISIIIWILLDFRKLSLWVTAGAATLICCLPMNVLHPLDVIITSEFLAENFSHRQSIMSMVVEVVYLLILTSLTVIVFSRKDIMRVIEREK